MRQQQLLAVPKDLGLLMTSQEHVAAGMASPMRFPLFRARRRRWYTPLGIVNGTMDETTVRAERSRVHHVPITETARQMLSRRVAFTGGTVVVVLAPIDPETNMTLTDPRVVIGDIVPSIHSFDLYNDHTQAMNELYGRALHLRSPNDVPNGGRRRSRER